MALEDYFKLSSSGKTPVDAYYEGRDAVGKEQLRDQQILQSKQGVLQSEQQIVQSKQSVEQSKQQMQAAQILGEQKNQLFKDRTRFLDMYKFANKIGSLPYDQQTELLVQRRDKLLQEGKDPTETNEALNADEATRKQMVAGMYSMGVQLGHLKQPTAARADKMVPAINNATGKQEFVSASVLRANPGAFAPIAKSPLVTIGGKAEVEGQKKLLGSQGSTAGKSLEKIATDGEAAQTNMRNINSMGRLMISVPEVGALADFRLKWSKLAKTFGAGPEFIKSIGGVKNVAQAEAIKASGMSFVLAFVSQTKGSISEKEMALFEGASPGLQNTRKGNLIILNFAKSLAQRQIDKAKFYRNKGVFKTIGAKNQADRDWESHMAKNPVISEKKDAKTGLPILYSTYKKYWTQKGKSQKMITDQWRIFNNVK